VGGRLIIIVGTTGLAVKLAGDGVCDVRQLLLLLLEIFGGGVNGVGIEPLGGLLDGVEKLFKLV
jgi:hypothetical protein